ncbi:CPBP family intramembrane glutamic endopeptidase [Lactococcus nasutitermitis]|uniref:CPBP family intramembrane glutamic endopeptidase n=1 Tax=Lactococcus nasutitermitis TaxID=1652957 RepID=A0ABV9JCG3_9LACT|nr:type II CAAX endopeptidase family protein [Lactococcus nasutitermitis]
MKKVIIIFAITIGYIIGLGRLFWLLKITGILHLPHLTGLAGIAANTLIQDVPLLALFIFLNIKFFKQKILFERYSWLKTVGILWLAWLYLAITINAVIVKHSSFPLILLNLLAFFIVGAAEEFIFRGLIFGSLVSRGKSLPFAVAVSSILFGLTHLVNLTHQSLNNTLLQVIYVVALGVLLATIYMKSNNLLLPIILHTAIDFTAVSLTSSVNSTHATVGSVIGLYVVVAIIVVPYLLTGKKQLSLFKKRLEN